MRYGGDGVLTQATCGVVCFDHIAGQQLISFLPKVLLIDNWADEESSWLQSTLRFITNKAEALKPGGETVITHLADILIIQAIRSWIDSAPTTERGWLAALKDRYLGRALSSIHRSPEKTGLLPLWRKRSGCHDQDSRHDLPIWLVNRSYIIWQNYVWGPLERNCNNHRILYLCSLIVWGINLKQLLVERSKESVGFHLAVYAKWI